MLIPKIWSILFNSKRGKEKRREKKKKEKRNGREWGKTGRVIETQINIITLFNKVSAGARDTGQPQARTSLMVSRDRIEIFITRQLPPDLSKVDGPPLPNPEKEHIVFICVRKIEAYHPSMGPSDVSLFSSIWSSWWWGYHARKCRIQWINLHLGRWNHTSTSLRGTS